MSERVRMLRVLCSHCDSKRSCGAVLAVFIRGSGLAPQEAVGLVYDVISFDFFSDLRGKMKDLKAQLPHLSSLLENYLAERERLDQDGDIMDPDQDDQGNLQGFVVYSDESCTGTRDSGESNEESTIHSIDHSIDDDDNSSANSQGFSDVNDDGSGAICDRDSPSKQLPDVKRVSRIVYSDSEDDS